MRMQFWRDAIDGVFRGTTPAEPVAVLLAKVIHQDQAPLGKGWFLKIINARVCGLPLPEGPLLHSFV
jgi:hypothetical protein